MMGVEYRYLADTPNDGTVQVSMPLKSTSDGRMSTLTASAKKKYGKATTVRVERREVGQWEPVATPVDPNQGSLL